MPNYQIAASLLSADFARLGKDAQAVIDAGADALHFDAMDNHFVPNLTIGPLVCAALRRYGIKADINVHLMASPIDKLIADFAEAGATGIIFHLEASEHIEKSLARIREMGCKTGLALRPQSPANRLVGFLDQLDYILVMSVNPGFGGQTFIPATLDKIREIRNLITTSKYNICLAVDGGIKIDNIAQIAQAGAERFVIGSGIFTQPDYAQAISAMHQQLR
jgi:ribulose-phosphate 3-epimerase